MNYVFCERNQLTSVTYLFVLYTADLGGVADKHGVNSHLRRRLSLQLYLSGSARQLEARDADIVACMEDIVQWMATNRGAGS